LVGLECARGRFHPNGGAALRDREDLDSRAYRCAELLRARQLRLDAALRKNVPSAGLVIGLLVALEIQELREAMSHLSPVDHFMRDAEVTRGPDRARDEIRLAVVRRLADTGRYDDEAAWVQQLGRRLGFELTPDPVRIQHQGHV